MPFINDTCARAYVVVGVVVAAAVLLVEQSVEMKV